MAAERIKKDDYPKVIADWLGIPPVEGKGGPWMSTEGTVMKEWLEAVGEALDVPYLGEKVRTMKALVERVGSPWDPVEMSSKATRSGGGGNITEKAFVALRDGLSKDATLSQAASARRSERHFVRDRGNGGQGRRTIARGRPFVAGLPSRSDDLRVLRALLIRRGQPQFRANLLAAYSGRCAVTACGVGEVLEAAHVVPYRDGGTYSTSNGILLRADLHTLFDSGLLAFDHDRRVVLHPRLTGSEYEPLAGVRLRDPASANDRVPTPNLIAHRERMGL